jgi:hypothetical protein
MAVPPKAIYIFNAIPLKIPITFITEIEKSTLKFIQKHKRLRKAKAMLSKKEQCWRYHHTNLKLYYKTITIKQHGTGRKTDMKTNRTE